MCCDLNNWTKMFSAAAWTVQCLCQFVSVELAGCSTALDLQQQSICLDISAVGPSDDTSLSWQNAGTYSWGSPPWTDFYQILHIRRYAGRNHLCKFWCGKIKGFGIFGRVKFWVLPLKWLVTLTTVLRYRAQITRYGPPSNFRDSNYYVTQTQQLMHAEYKQQNSLSLQKTAK